MSHYLTVNLKLSSYPPIIAATLLATDTFPEIKTSSKRFFSHLPLSFPENTSADSLLRVCCKLREACNRLGGLDDVEEVEEEDDDCGWGGGAATQGGPGVGGGVGGAVGFTPETVLSCSWMSIM